MEAVKPSHYGPVLKEIYADQLDDGLIVLPPPKWPRPPRRPMVFGPGTGPSPVPPLTTLDEVRSLSLCPFLRYAREGKLWNGFIAHYLYLGYKTLVGAQKPTA